MREFYSKEIHVNGTPIVNLNSREYEDSRDATYLKTLKMNKGFDAVTKFAIEHSIEKKMIYYYTGSCIRVTKDNMPYLYECVRRGCEILGIETVPETYVLNDSSFNAFTMGSKNPILVLHNFIIKHLTHEELMYLIGHELGHIKSEHCQYHMIGELITQILPMATQYIPVVGNIVSIITSNGLGYAYYDWSRKSEYTADRAGLLCCQSLPSAITALMKLAGYPEEFYGTMNPNDIISQAMTFKGLEEDLYTKLLSFQLTRGMTHPWAVDRTKELLLWVQRGEYSRILMRSSKWLHIEQMKLQKKIVNQENKLLSARESADKAAYTVMQNAAMEEAVSQDDNKKNANVLMKGMKSIQNKMNVSMAKAKKTTADNASEKLEDLLEKQKEIQMVITEVDEDLVNQHIEDSLNGLERIPGVVPTFIGTVDTVEEIDEISVENTAKICPNCQAEIPEGGKFCMKCGTKIEE